MGNSYGRIVKTYYEGDEPHDMYIGEVVDILVNKS